MRFAQCWNKSSTVGAALGAALGAVAAAALDETVDDEEEVKADMNE